MRLVRKKSNPDEKPSSEGAHLDTAFMKVGMERRAVTARVQPAERIV